MWSKTPKLLCLGLKIESKLHNFLTNYTILYMEGHRATIFIFVSFFS